MKFTGIIAMAKNRVIGANNKLPWYYKEDLQFFKEKTWGGNVIMGRKTYDGLGRVSLPNRQLWVLTSYQNTPEIDKVNFFSNPAELPNLDFWVAGGLSVYQLTMPIISEFYVTYIQRDYEGDTVMPEFEHLFACQEIIKSTPLFEIKRYTK